MKVVLKFTVMESGELCVMRALMKRRLPLSADNSDTQHSVILTWLKLKSKSVY